MATFAPVHSHKVEIVNELDSLAGHNHAKLLSSLGRLGPLPDKQRKRAELFTHARTGAFFLELRPCCCYSLHVYGTQKVSKLNSDYHTVIMCAALDVLMSTLNLAQSRPKH